MARPKQPTVLHEIKGSFNKNPKRRPKGEPRPKGGIGPAPKWMIDAEAEIWDELVGIVPPGVLTDADRWIVERVVKLMWIARYDEERFTGAKEGHFISYLSRMGLTPSDRAKISIDRQDEQDDPAAKYF